MTPISSRSILIGGTIDNISYPTGGISINTELYKPSAVGVAEAGAVVLAYGSDGFVDNHSGPWKTMLRDFVGAKAPQTVMRDWRLARVWLAREMHA